MAQNNAMTKFAEILQEISEPSNPFLEMLQRICREVMEFEVNQQLKADRSQRTEDRAGYRSGYRSRRLDTRLGMLRPDVPGGYVQSFMERWQRSEQALITTIHDIYVMGVSTRKV